ncbi:MAG: hypothetical protein V3T40_01570 [Nitrososphaerales archaeon]
MGCSLMTRNKKDNLAYSIKMHLITKRSLAISTIVLLATMVVPLGHAQFDITKTGLVEITAKSWKTITVIKVENSKDNIYNAKLVWLTLQSGVIGSYRAEDGWSTEASSKNPNAIQFRTDTNVIKPGESARFGIKSDQSNPIFKWIVIDEEGDELGSGAIDVVKAIKEEAIKTSSRDNTDVGENNSTQPPTTSSNDKPNISDKKPAIAVIPDTARPRLVMRILGEGFMPDSRITVLFDGKLIETLKTESDGTIRARIKIPETAVDGAHQISVSDSSGRAANLPITVVNVERTISFTITTEQETYKQGDLVKIVGVGKPEAAVSLNVVDPAGVSIFSSAVPVDKASKYTVFIPLDSTAVTGEYLITALQDARTITAKFIVLTESGYEMLIVTDKFEYKQSENVIITGQTSPNKDINVRVLDPNGAVIFKTDIRSNDNGKFTTAMIVPADASLGKYSVAVKAGKEEIALTFSVARGSITLTVQTDKIEYRDGELVRISGKGKPNERLSITVLTPNDDRIPMSANIKEDGTYTALWLIQKTADAGTYTVIVQEGNSRAEAFFAVFS